MSHPNPDGKNPEHIRNVLARIAAETGETELARELGHTATIVRPARYDVPGQNGPAQLIDQDDDAETYHWGESRIACKGKCAGYSWHDIYVEVEGRVQLQCRTYAVCRDCQHEQPGEVMSGIGSIQPRSLERTTREAAARAKQANRARGKAQRAARRKQRR